MSIVQRFATENYVEQLLDSTKHYSTDEFVVGKWIDGREFTDEAVILNAIWTEK